MIIINKQPSLKDVAKLAKVGLGTASRVLNNNPSVKPFTREKVLQAMKELNYRPNIVARSLKTNSTNSIGILLSDVTSNFASEVIRGIQDVAEENNYSIFSRNTYREKIKVLNDIGAFVEKKVDGIIFIGGVISDEVYKDIVDFNLPLVTISSATTIKPEGKFASVGINNFNASYEAVEYLINKGHSKIGTITGIRYDPNSGFARTEGYLKALSDYQLPIVDEWIIEGRQYYKGGYNSAKQMFSLSDVPTALFIASDDMALGASKALFEMGYTIPDDVALIGFDGLEYTSYLNPSISTVFQPRYEMGSIGMKLMLKLLKNEPMLNRKITLDHKLIINQSC